MSSTVTGKVLALPCMTMPSNRRPDDVQAGGIDGARETGIVRGMATIFSPAAFSLNFGTVTGGVRAGLG